MADMSEIILQAKVRDVKKERSDELRTQGFIPAVLYGPKMENINMAVADREFESFLKSGHKTKPFSLKLDNGQSIANILLQNFDRDTLKNKILNVDFYQFDVTKKVKVSLPVFLEGKAPAREIGGVVVLSMSEIEVECLPVNIPDKITVDVSVLVDFDSTICVKDLEFPSDIVCHIEPHTSVVSVSEPLKEEVVLPSVTEETSVETKDSEVKEKTEAPSSETK